MKRGLTYLGNALAEFTWVRLRSSGLRSALAGSAGVTTRYKGREVRGWSRVGSLVVEDQEFPVRDYRGPAL